MLVIILPLCSAVHGRMHWGTKGTAFVHINIQQAAKSITLLRNDMQPAVQDPHTSHVEIREVTNLKVDIMVDDGGLNGSQIASFNTSHRQPLW